MEADWEGAGGVADEPRREGREAREDGAGRARGRARPAGAQRPLAPVLARVLAVLGAIGLFVSVALVVPVTSLSRSPVPAVCSPPSAASPRCPART